MNYSERIVIKSDIRFGKPCVKNTRISVYDILGCLASGMSFNQITEDFPKLSKTDILAALSFAANRERRYRIA